MGKKKRGAIGGSVTLATKLHSVAERWKRKGNGGEPGGNDLGGSHEKATPGERKSDVSNWRKIRKGGEKGGTLGGDWSCGFSSRRVECSVEIEDK